MSISLAAAAGAGGGNIWTIIGPFILMFVVFYFLLIRPQQKKQKTRNLMLNQVKKGDKIVTIGGLHGTIAEITDDVVVLRVNDTTKLTFDRSAISTVSQSAPSAD
ncbi:preprotein translocase subunit YajC [Paenibacillus endoradicis]|uniref:preprotein translocase subunit YajC n=1 Tax=Paenibacillus endoradicis TaxID=2972487 RepID=UPI00215932CC|nr:preprotein translocase subunit YajC [Paenibacillus endoradicis]MCR8655739.1 preprotein translocase subunit YajC [Paenibacillus endoradicis]MCR8658065.1 preprotein translocase subunit YajC [Paenibacillus endoradicis]